MKLNECKMIKATMVFSLFSIAYAGSMLEKLQIKNSCGPTYIEKLKSCESFRCEKPNLLGMMYTPPSKEEMAKMPKDKQLKLKKQIEAFEKKLAKMSPQQFRELKEKITSVTEIKGYNDKGLCQFTVVESKGYRQECTVDKKSLQKIANYEELVLNAKNIRVKSTSQIENGKMVTKQIDIIDGKEVSNPWQEALSKKECIFNYPKPNSK